MQEGNEMNMYVAFGIFGIISNLAAAFADVPLIKPGKPTGNDKISLNGVQPWWAEVPEKRFTVSFWLSFLGQPGAYVVLWLLADLISQNNAPLAMALKINTFISCYTGLLSHLYFCLRPLLYQKLSKKMSDDESEEVLKAINPVANVPMLIGGLTLWFGGTIIVAIAILTGALEVSKWCLLLNPIVAVIVLMTLKKCKVKVIGALGVGYTLLSVLLIIAGM